MISYKQSLTAFLLSISLLLYPEVSCAAYDYCPSLFRFDFTGLAFGFTLFFGLVFAIKYIGNRIVSNGLFILKILSFFKILIILTIISVILALFDMPSEYYWHYMRLLIFIDVMVAVFIAFVLGALDEAPHIFIKRWLIISIMASGLIHNPILKLCLGSGSKTFWIIANITTVWLLYLLYNRSNSEWYLHHNDHITQDDENHFRHVGFKEIASKNHDQATWDQAFALAEGNHNNAVQVYVRLRVQQFEKDHTKQIVEKRNQEYERAQEKRRIAEEQQRIQQENEKRAYNSLLEKYKSLKGRRLKRNFVYYTISLIPAILLSILLIRGDDSFSNNISFLGSSALIIEASTMIFIVSSLISVLLILLLFRRLRLEELAISKDLMPLDKTLARKIKTSSKPKLFWTSLILAFFIFSFAGSIYKNENKNGNFDAGIALTLMNKGEDPTNHALEAEKKGNLLGSVILGDWAYQRQNYTEAFNYYSKVAQSKEATLSEHAKVSVAFMYATGLGTEIDLKKAFSIASKVQGSSPLKSLAIGLSSYFDAELENNELAAKEFLNVLNSTDATPDQKGFASSFYGTLLINQLIQDKPSSAAFSYLKVGADANTPHAYYPLAFCYEEGLGVTQDHAKAIEYYLAAAESETDIRGYYRAGILYLNDDETFDADKGIGLIKKGAYLGDPDAQADLGVILWDGLPGFLEGNKIEALALLLSATRKTGIEREELKSFRESLSPADHEEAENRSLEL